jgi:hypothetical protein
MRREGASGAEKDLAKVDAQDANVTEKAAESASETKPLKEPTEGEEQRSSVGEETAPLKVDDKIKAQRRYCQK